MSSLKKTVFIPLVLFTSLFWAYCYAASGPQPNPFIKAKAQSSSSQNWSNVSLTLTNTGPMDVDLKNSSIEMNLPTAIDKLHGSFSPLSWPTISVNSTPSGSVTKVTIGLNFGTESWVQTVLPPNKSITLQFGLAKTIDNASLSDSVKVYTTGSTLISTSSLMPYKDMTFNMNWSTNPVTSNLQEIANNSRHYSYTLAFITQNAWDTSRCSPAWGGQPTLALGNKLYQKEAQYVRSKNGVLSVSFGGENGLSIESKCTKAELVQAYQSTFDIYGATYIDFDIEGGALSDTSANTNRFNALKDLQARNRNAKVTLTLPANINGFPPLALGLIKQAKSLGVSIAQYNMMTMAWYSQKLPGPISDSVIASAQKGFQQLKAIFPEKSAAQIWSMIRVTPKIGVDYDQSILYPNDAVKIGQFVRQQGLAGIGFWSADIDRNQNKTQKCNLGANPDCSGVYQAPYDFTKSFLSGLGQ